MRAIEAKDFSGYGGLRQIELPHLLAVFEAPDAEHAVLPAGDDRFAVGRDGQGIEKIVRTAEVSLVAAVLRVVQSNGAVAGSGEDGNGSGLGGAKQREGDEKMPARQAGPASGSRCGGRSLRG